MKPNARKLLIKGGAEFITKDALISVQMVLLEEKEKNLIEFPSCLVSIIRNATTIEESVESQLDYLDQIQSC